MAATRLIAMHVNKGKTLAQCLEARTDYAQNPEKTEKGNLVTAYECDPMTRRVPAFQTAVPAVYRT